MPFKVARPETRADAEASTASAAAKAFYSQDQAANYTTAANAGIQRDLTEHALELLYLCSGQQQHDLYMLLDLGAGSGLSTKAALHWLGTRATQAFAVAFDISASMLSLTEPHQARVGHEGDTEYPSPSSLMQHSAFYCGNAAQRFPLRAGLFHSAIGISMLQWLTDTGLRVCYESLFQTLVPQAAAVFQVYPTSSEQVTAMEQAARDAGFTYAEVLVAFPHPTTAKKWYLVLRKGRDESDTRHDGHQDLCPFGRRHHRRCTWHLLEATSQERQVNNTESEWRLLLRDRLVKEHVKEAWHIWRKFKRAMTQPATPHGATLHAKAKRSLELWKSDEMIGEALRDRFTPTATDQATSITYNLLLEHGSEVVQLVHKAYTAAVAVEQSLITTPAS